MDALTQDLLAAGLLLLAVSYLAWRGYRTLRGKKTGCGCDTCPAVKRANDPSTTKKAQKGRILLGPWDSMTETREMSRRRARIAMTVAFIVMTVAGIFTGCWFLLPRWAPVFVASHSPWIGPIVQAAKNDAEAESVARWRLLDWEPLGAQGELYACMRSPDLRATALAVFPLRTPYSEPSSASIDDEAERRIVLVKTFEDQGKRWHLIRCASLATFEIPDSESASFAPIQAAFLDRSRNRVIPHPYESGSSLALIHFEFVCDVSVPYWIIDRFLDLAMRQDHPSDPIIGSIHITVHGDDPSQEWVLWTSPLPAPAPALAHVVTIRGVGLDRRQALIQIDDGAGVMVSGEVDSAARRQAIADILHDVLSAHRVAGTARPHISVRGDREAVWGDIVAALNAALHEHGMRGHEWVTGFPERLSRITLMRQAPPIAGQVGP